MSPKCNQRKCFFNVVSKIITAVVICNLAPIGHMEFAGASDGSILIDYNMPGYYETANSGTWGTTANTVKVGYENSDSRLLGSTNTGYAEYRPAFAVSGMYRVYVYKLANPDGLPATDYYSDLKAEVAYNGGTYQKGLDFNLMPVGWNDLGTYNFSADGSCYVRIKKDAAISGNLRVDAMKFVPVVSADDVTATWLATSTNFKDIKVSSDISIIFSKQMNTSLLTGSKFVLKEARTGAAVGTTVTIIGTNIVNIHPTSTLNYAFPYILKINPGVKDTDGNELSGRRAWGFATEAFIMDSDTTVSPGYSESGSGWTSRSGVWGTPTPLNGSLRYCYTVTPGSGTYACYTPNLPAGKYKVSFNNCKGESATTPVLNAELNVVHAGGTYSLSPFSQLSTTRGIEVQELGTFVFQPGTSHYVQFRVTEANKNLRIDMVKFEYPNDEYFIEDASFADNAGTVNPSPVPDTVRVTLPIVNLKGSSLNCTAIFALYDSNNMLKDFVMAEQSVNPNQTETYGATLTGCAPGDYIKAMVWDGIGTMLPLNKVSAYPAL